MESDEPLIDPLRGAANVIAEPDLPSDDNEVSGGDSDGKTEALTRRIELSEFSRDVYGYSGRVYFGRETLILRSDGKDVVVVSPVREERKGEESESLEVDEEMQELIGRARDIFRKELERPEVVINRALQDFLELHDTGKVKSDPEHE